MKNILTSAFFIFFIAPMLTGCVSDNGVKNENDNFLEQIYTNSQQESKTKSKEKDGLKKFTNNVLSLEFNYPEEFGVINIMEDGNDHYGLRLFNEDIFLAADNGNESVKRGAYWGDTAEFIDNQEYINNFCNEKKDCVVNNNSNGITFAKWNKEVKQLDGEVIESIYYYIYNSYSDYRGIIVSDERIKKHNFTDLEVKMDEMIDSFYFLKQ